MELENLILLPEVRSFIKGHENDRIPDLILKGSPFENITIQDIAQQIKGLQISKSKFPGLYNNDQIIFPPKINLEQSSSEITAGYKARLISKNEKIIDLTGGMGIDAMAFYDFTKSVTYLEIDENTFSYAKHNFKASQKNIISILGNGIKYLQNVSERYDLIYIDPARRDKHNSKVFKLEDCQPNVLDHIDLFKAKASKLMIKASPLLDINQSLELLPYVESIHIVSVKNEVKEILILIDFGKKITDPLIHAVNLDSDQQIFSGKYSERKIEQNLSLPKPFLYEPNSSIMKSGFFGKVCKDFDIEALHTNSHLFTSEKKIEFPGRKFEIIKAIQPKKKEINKYLYNNKANISTRNYPLKPEQIKKKYRIGDGGSFFVFFTTNLKNEKIALICKKLIE
jgi:16S rRNA G966 N2-methylase RsmD